MTITKTMGKNNYHPYKKQNHGKNCNSGALPIGINGFLCTFNTMKKQSENQCVREAYNILNEYSEKLNVPDKKDVTLVDAKTDKTNSESKPIEVDIEDELKSELEELKNDDVKKHKFQKLDCGAQGNIFIKINEKSIDPVTLGTSIVEDLDRTKQQKTIHLLRLIPVEITCKSYLDDITKAIGPLIDKHFSGAPTTYCIVFNKRNNNNLERASVIEFAALLVKEKNMFHTVDLKQAALTIVFEVIKNVCCISVLPDYYKYKKYNLCEITYPVDKVKSGPSGGDGHEQIDTKSNKDEESSKEDTFKEIEAEPREIKEKGDINVKEDERQVSGDNNGEENSLDINVEGSKEGI